VCPRHKSADDIRLVSVVCGDGVIPAARAASPGVTPGAKERLLSPCPELKAANRLAWTGTGCGVAGMAAIWIGDVIGGGAFGPGLLCAGVCFAYALAIYGWAAARRSRIARVERGIPAALALWRTAWYCERCDGVFFPPGEVLLTPAEFRREVWSAGGYGDLRPAGAPEAITDDPVRARTRAT
jgi:hypothetical protein